MQVIIGVDPHKASHTAVAIDDDEDELAQMSVRATRTQTQQLLAWAEPFERGRGRSRAPTGWAICCPSSSSLPANASLMCRPRWRRGHGCWRGPVEQERPERRVVGRDRRRCGTRSLREVQPVGHSEVLRLLAKRNIDIGNQRTPGRVAGCTRCWSSSHRAGSPRKSTLPTSTRSSPGCHPTTPVEQIRYDLAVELLDDIRRLDEQLKASHKRIRTAVAASAHDASPTCSVSGRSSPRC